MKKTLTIILVIIIAVSTTLALVGCKQSFGAKNIREEIENELGWHEGGFETCVYDVFDGEDKVGEFTSSLIYVNNKSVSIETSIEEQNRTLDNFTGYEFATKMRATYDDGKTYERTSVSYADLTLAPQLSYTKEVSEQSIEIISSYDTKRVNVTFITDGSVSDDSVKYKSGTLTYDNSYIYQFARTTDMSTSLSINAPTYTVSGENQRVSKSSFAVTYTSDMTTLLDSQFVLNRQFIATGDNESETTSGAFDEKRQPQENTDDEGKTTITYPYTKTSVIPTVKCTFTSANSSLVKGSISCYIATNSLKMQDSSGRFASRAVVMMQEGKMTYKLKSIYYSINV